MTELAVQQETIRGIQESIDRTREEIREIKGEIKETRKELLSTLQKIQEKHENLREDFSIWKGRSLILFPLLILLISSLISFSVTTVLSPKVLQAPPAIIRTK